MATNIPAVLPEPNIDIAFENHGSIVLIHGVSEVGQAWLDENVGDSETQYLCGAIVCEPRYVEAILRGAQSERLAVRL
jgi:hypothetical protein